MIQDSVRNHLIDLYEEKKGKRGSLMKVIDYFEDEILEMRRKRFPIQMIVEEIEKKLNYKFQKDQAINPLFRAIEAFLKKTNGKPKKRERREPEPDMVKVSSTDFVDIAEQTFGISDPPQDFGEKPNLDIFEEKQEQKKSKRSHLAPKTFKQKNS